MCGRFTMLTADELREAVDAVAGRTAVRALGAATSRRQAFPGSTIPAIARGDRGVAADELHWGFPTEWGKGTVFNTRIESALAGAPMWCDAVRDGRCIIPAASFFEPHQTEKATSPRTGKAMKRPYAFRSGDGLPLLLAGVSAEGNCSVVTCEPNRWVSPVHPRMPLVLRFEEVPLWLDGDVHDLAQLADRTHIDLAARPELDLAESEQSGQLPLF